MSTRDVDRFRLLPGGFWSPNQPGEYATFVLRGDFEVKGESRFARFMQETSWSFRVRHEYVTNDNRIEFNFTKKF